MRAPCPDLSRKIYRRIETWRTERLGGDFTHLSLDGVILKRSTLRDSVKRLGLFVIGWAAIESAILGVAAIEKENLEGWRGAGSHWYFKVRGIAAFGDYFRGYS
jgi:hypothetical protein